MIPILYSSTETEFNTNGIGLLSDAADCTVNEVLNGEYEMTMKYPVTGIHFSSLAMRCIILAAPDPVSEAQPFRIYRITKPLKGIVTVYARHIAYDLMGITVPPFSADTADDAMQELGKNALTDCPFSFWTDKSTSATMTVAAPSSIWNLLGGSEGGILDCYGGEYEFDRLTVKLHGRRGADRGVSIRYGKNLTDLEQDENCANCYTGVYPYWADQDGNLVQLSDYIVEAEGDFDYVKIYPLDLSSEWEEAPTEDALRARAENYIEDNDIGVPSVSWTVAFAQLEQTEEYKGKALLEQVLLGDTVTVIFPDMNVNATARATKIKYNVLLERYEFVTLGKVKASIADTIISQSKEIEKKTDVTLTQQISKSIAKAMFGVNGGSVRLLDTDGDGEPDTLYIADNADPNLAVKVWRWNYLGWAASENGYNGPFVMGATLEDGILANAVTAAKLTAGTIQSADGETFYLDLDNGILRIKTVTEMQEAVDNSLSSVEILYALGESATTAPTSGWSSTAPEWVDGMYMWQKTITTKSSGGTEETVTCISGATGSAGEAGADGADAITLIIDSSNGDSFKNSKISTTLTVNIIVAGNYIDCSRKMYEYFGDSAVLLWETRGYGEDDYTAVASDDPRLSDNGFIFTLTTADVDTKIVCRCYLDY